MKPIEYARLGAVDQDWRGYEYQVRWSVRDRPTVGVPAKDDQWIATEDPAVSLVPPFERRIVDIDSDPALLKQAGIVTAVVEFATPLVGKPQLQRKATAPRHRSRPAQDGLRVSRPRQADRLARDVVLAQGHAARNPCRPRRRLPARAPAGADRRWRGAGRGYARQTLIPIPTLPAP
jgi:hypothetical protein